MQAACGHDLYSPYCGVDRALYRITRTVTNISGTQIEINGSALVDNTLAQGYAEWINAQSSTLVRRSIASNLNGGEINFTYLVANLQLGQSIDLYPGCNKVLDGDCLNKFADNTINHGGKTHLTVKQPFGSGSRIF